MRNLKRVLSLALASVMVVSMMVIGAGAANFDDFSDKDEIVNKEAVSVLVELGVLAGKDDGSYDPTGIITRGEMAKIICVVLNKGQDPNLGTVNSNTYTDTVGHWAAPYIEYCTTLGIVAGKGDGTFAPNDTVTASEASKMLLVALGYNAQYESMIGANWAVATNVLANKNGLYDGLTLDVSAGLTRDNAAQMMYNALDAKVVEYEYAVIPSGDSISSIATAKYRQGEPTMLEYVFDAVKVTGIVLANEYGTVDNTKNAQKEGETWVNVTNNTTSNPEQSKLGDGKYNFATDMDLLGKKIDFYAIPGTSSVPAQAKILGSAIVSSENTVVTLTSGGTKSIEDRLKSEDMKVAGATYVTNYTEFGAFAGTNKTVNGVEIVAIDNDDDGVAEYVLQNFKVFGKVTAYSTKDDGSIAVSAFSVGSHDGLTYGFWDSDASTYTKAAVKMDDSADVIGFEDVAKDDYVFAQEIGGKLYVSVAEAVELVPTSTKGTDFIADGTTYKQAGTVADVDENGSTADLAAAVEIGTAASVYMDAYGYVVRVTDVETTVKYLYVTKATGSTDLSAQANVVFADGSKANSINVSSVNGNSGAYAIAGTIYSYSTNNKGEYSLTNASASNARFAATTIKSGEQSAVDSKGNYIAKGNATLKTAAGTIYANADTVFVVSNTTGSWSVYTGIANVPNLKANSSGTFTADVAYNSTDKFADVVFVTASDLSTSSDMAKVVYFLNKNATVTKDSNDEFIYTYDVVYEGEKTTLQATSDLSVPNTGLFMPTFDGSNKLTAYGSETSSAKATKAEAGVITLSAAMNIGGTPYGTTFTVNKDTVILAIDDDNVTPVDLNYITVSVPGTVGDDVIVVPDKDNNNLAAYVFILE